MHLTRNVNFVHTKMSTEIADSTEHYKKDKNFMPTLQS